MKYGNLNLLEPSGPHLASYGTPLPLIGGILIIYIYNKTSIIRNILTIKLHREVGRAKDISAPLYALFSVMQTMLCS